MTKIAKFTDGTTDVYKGKRNVTAAYQLTLPCGRKISGHSLDRKRAESTARSRASENAPYLLGMVGGRGGRWQGVTPAAAKYFREVANREGFATAKEFNAAQEIKRAAFHAACKIEIVDL